MASTSKCSYCGATIRSTDQNCPHCGAPNPNYVAETPRQIFLPRTIEELKEYCAERGMPLLRMRFFIGENFKEPRAFGIYKEGSDFIVYKNKANGQRAVRYKGPNEEYAVSELFQKLLQECHNRGIYPDGKPSDRYSGGSSSGGNRNVTLKKILIFFTIFVFACGLIGGIVGAITHRHDGYYITNDHEVYYHYGSDWYTSDDYYWYEVSDFPYDSYGDYYAGDDYESDWGVSDFKSSDIWYDMQESSSSSSSDYDSWDSSDTDWDSDW